MGGPASSGPPAGGQWRPAPRALRDFQNRLLSWVSPQPEPQPHLPGELAFLPGTPGPEAPTEGWVGGAGSGNGHRTDLDKYTMARRRVVKIALY